MLQLRNIKSQSIAETKQKRLSIFIFNFLLFFSNFLFHESFGKGTRENENLKKDNLLKIYLFS
jgi:hypothetical protein